MTLLAEMTNSGETLLNGLRKRFANQTDRAAVTAEKNGAHSNGTYTNGVYRNGAAAQPAKTDAFGKLASFWKKGETLYQKHLPEAVALNADMAQRANDMYARSKEFYRSEVEPVNRYLYQASIEVYDLSKEAWDRGMVVLERVSEERLKPILGDAQRDGQLREFAGDAKTQQRNPTTQEVDRTFAIATASLGISILGGLFYAPLHLLSIPGVLYGASGLFRNSYLALRKERKVHVNVLTSLTVITCLVDQQFLAANLAIFFYAFSRKLLTQVKDDSQKSLVNIFRQSATYAWVLVDEVETQIPLEELKLGDRVIVNAGEVIPVDGIIVKGTATIDQHILTGEAQPVERGEGDTVFALTLLLMGRIQVRVEQAGQETTAARIGELLNRTSNFKTNVQLMSEDVAQKTVWPTLILSAISLPLLGPLGSIAVITAHFGNRMTTIGGIGILNYFRILSRYGILVKDGRILEMLHKVDTVVFDKTGTLTQEQPTVGTIYTCDDYSEDAMIRLAAAAEYRQTHPLARAILQEAHTRDLILPAVDDSIYKVGYGLSIHIEGQLVRVGSVRFMEEEKVPIPAHICEAQSLCAAQGDSLVLVALDQALMGAIALQPSVRPEAMSIIQGLHERGIQSIVIISGDQEAPTRRLAQELGIDRYFAETLPENKASIIEQLQAEGRTICYVGDGINDTIALKKAQVSISLRGASTAATDTAQIILMDQSLRQLCRVFDLGHEFMSMMRTSLGILLTSVALNIGGIYFLNTQVVSTLILKDLFTLISVGNAMLPLQKYRMLLADSSEHQPTQENN